MEEINQLSLSPQGGSTVLAVMLTSPGTANSFGCKMSHKTVFQLKQELARLEAKTSGKKADLVAR